MKFLRVFVAPLWISPNVNLTIKINYDLYRSVVVIRTLSFDSPLMYLFYVCNVG